MPSRVRYICAYPFSLIIASSLTQPTHLFFLIFFCSQNSYAFLPFSPILPFRFLAEFPFEKRKNICVAKVKGKVHRITIRKFVYSRRGDRGELKSLTTSGRKEWLNGIRSRAAKLCSGSINCRKCFVQVMRPPCSGGIHPYATKCQFLGPGHSCTLHSESDSFVPAVAIFYAITNETCVIDMCGCKLHVASCKLCVPTF